MSAIAPKGRNICKPIGVRKLAHYNHITLKTGSRRDGSSLDQNSTTARNSLKEAVDWAEGKNVPVRVTTVEVPMVDVCAMRKRLGLSQASFAAKLGFQTATVRNWEQGRTRPDGPARVLLAVIARHPDAVEDALRQAN